MTAICKAGPKTFVRVTINGVLSPAPHRHSGEGLRSSFTHHSMVRFPNPSFAGLTRESSDGDGRVKHGHDDFQEMELFLLPDNIPRCMYMVSIGSVKEAVIAHDRSSKFHGRRDPRSTLIFKGI
jgi:hypothetical protein